jgi:hypothetical protein
VFFVRVFTTAGDQVDSEQATITLGDVPGAPTLAPSLDLSGSSASRLLIDYPAIPASLNGGLVVESYSLELDDGAGGSFTQRTGFTVNSLATSFLITTNIMEGTVYQARYRARNAYGWGPYSPVSALLAA